MSAHVVRQGIDIFRSPTVHGECSMRVLFAAILCGVLMNNAVYGDDDENAKSDSDERTLKVGEPIKVVNGTLVVVQQTDGVPSPGQLLIHFHGALETTRKALARSEFRGTMVVVNFPGLSSAYSQPFVDHPELLEEIIGHAKTTPEDTNSAPNSRIILSSFSAGYGAIREILKSPSHFAGIDAIVTADSIYAGLDAETPARVVSRENMSEFLRFAELATKGEKQFVLSHSAQTTPYASTTETADYLLHKLRITRAADSATQRSLFTQTSKAQQGKFTVLGFSGETGHHHMQHLHQIDLLWNLLDGVE
jgi:hypothetical protein